MAKKRIFNVSASASFVDILAEHFLKTEKDNLSQVLFLLPNRRACRDLADAFVRANGLEPTILPQMKPVAEAEEDAVLLSGQANLTMQFAPAVSNSERLFYLSKQIMENGQSLGISTVTAAQAYELAQSLSVFFDNCQQQQKSLDGLDKLLENYPNYAEHWQRTLDLLTLLRKMWPQYLQQQNKTNIRQRQQLLLAAELDYWQQTKTSQRIVAAGITAAFPILKKLVKTVYDLPNGEVWLYGLDKYLSEPDWEQVEVHHPQYELKELLECLNLKRSEVQDVVLPEAREFLVSECMRPVKTTDVWRTLPQNENFSSALKGLQIVECDDMRQEANAVALIIRSTLENSKKTVALVTGDRNLARCVVAELKRWNITADDSAGLPLNQTPIGIYLRLIIETVRNNFTQTDCMALLKHPFTSCSMNKAKCRKLARQLELYWRHDKKYAKTTNNEEQVLLAAFQKCLQPLTDLYAKSTVSLTEILTAHIQTAENLASTDEKSGDKIIWRLDAGKMAADFVNDLLTNGEIFGAFKPYEYGSLFNKMLQTQNVRIRYGMHPQVKILGPIEARLTQFDITIIGEVNEGFWPASPASDMWMSRQMREDFGLPDKERAIGVCAADFAHLLNSKEVYLTRAARLDGAPTAKSRWLLRLETVLTALLGKRESIYNLYDRQYVSWAKFAERAETLKPISAPQPRPTVEKRPLQLSASNIDSLFRDPYTIFAKYILQLYPLDDLDRRFDRRDYGNIVHKTVELFNRRYGASMPKNAKEELLRLGEEQFKAANIPTPIRVFWWPKFEQTADWLIATEQNYRQNITAIYNEIEGKMKWPLSNGTTFTLTGKADRIDITDDGMLHIIDYKTGSGGYPQSLREMKLGYAPQLPTEALIALNGGYADISAHMPINTLAYWLLGKDTKELKEEEVSQVISLTQENIKKRLHEFYEQTPPAPYVYKPDPLNVTKYSDYEHLARYREWGISDDKEG